MKRVMIFGTFDRFHKGHQFVIDEAKKRGHVIAIIARDHHVSEIKGRSSDQSETDRQKAVSDYLGADGEAVLGDQNNFLVPLEEYKPDLILMGYDQQFPPNISEQDIAIPIERLPAFEPEKYKSSKLREKF